MLMFSNAVVKEAVNRGVTVQSRGTRLSAKYKVVKSPSFAKDGK
jgi:hypothetical protein